MAKSPYVPKAVVNKTLDDLINLSHTDIQRAAIYAKTYPNEKIKYEECIRLQDKVANTQQQHVNTAVGYSVDRVNHLEKMRPNILWYLADKANPYDFKFNALYSFLSSGSDKQKRLARHLLLKIPKDKHQFTTWETLESVHTDSNVLNAVRTYIMQHFPEKVTREKMRAWTQDKNEYGLLARRYYLQNFSQYVTEDELYGNFLNSTDTETLALARKLIV